MPSIERLLAASDAPPESRQDTSYAGVITTKGAIDLDRIRRRACPHPTNTRSVIPTARIKLPKGGLGDKSSPLEPEIFLTIWTVAHARNRG